LNTIIIENQNILLTKIEWQDSTVNN